MNSITLRVISLIAIIPIFVNPSFGQTDEDKEIGFIPSAIMVLDDPTSCGDVQVVAEVLEAGQHDETTPQKIEVDDSFVFRLHCLRTRC